MKALSIRQPWAHAVLHLGKCVENRTWTTDFRGRFLIHAGKGTGTLGDFTDDRDALADLLFGDERWTGFRDEHLDIRMFRGDAMFTPRASLLRGGIVGVATLADVIEPTGRLSEETDRWHAPEQFGFVLSDVRSLPFIPCKGALGFFDVDRDTAQAVRDLAGRGPT